MSEWQGVVGYEDYEVSDDGRVRRATPGRGTHVGREMGIRLTTTGYPSVMIGVPGNYRPRKIHQLVADAFIRPRVEGDVVNHLDGDKTNNHRANLEITTRAGNVAHAVAHGLIRQGIRRGMAKLTDEQIHEIRRDFVAGTSGQALADRYGISCSYVYNVAAGRERASA